MCKHCEEDKEVIGIFCFKECDLEIFIDAHDSLSINTYNNLSTDTEDIYGDLKINYCPMCGRELKKK